MNWNIYTYDTFFEKSVKTINSNNSTKFEVNWRRGSQFTAGHTKNLTKKYTDHKTINSNNYAKFEVNWPRGSQFTV